MADIRKISIALTGEQVSVLRAAVDSGEYATASEVVREALRDWQWKRELRIEDLQRLRADWRAGKKSGPAVAVDWPKTREQARRKLRKAAQRRA